MFQLCKDLLSRKNTEPLPRVHESVLKRVQNNAHLYAPKGLPQRYELVTAEGVVVPPEQNPYGPRTGEGAGESPGNDLNTICGAASCIS
jgi:hypothetical protein